MKKFLITTLAEYQTSFWLAVGMQLRNIGFEVAFISFDDRSSEKLISSGFKVYSVSNQHKYSDVSDEGIRNELEKYGIENINYWFGHERLAFGLFKSAVLRRKLLNALAIADQACVELSRNGPVVMIQELGGFLSVVGSYFAARKSRVDNWFIEPSFYRGRLFFIKNSFSALPITSVVDGDVSKEVDAYLRDTISKSELVIPKKDKHQYAMAWKKIVNSRNAKRFLEKLVDKYIFGKRQEFGYIRKHVLLHIKMLLNSFKLKKRYSPLDSLSRFIYYPLHVPGDMALTLRSPHYLDQLALVDFIARSVPYTHKVVIKEHPAMIGAVNSDRVIELLNRYDNLVMIPPSTNNFSVLSAADAVVSINSKSGAEATLLGKPVVVLGNAFYTDSPLVHRVDKLQDIPAVLRQVLKESKYLDSRQVYRYFESVWRKSFPGELYINEKDNVGEFTHSMLLATGVCKCDETGRLPVQALRREYVS